ncbi:hypothetical protein [Actinoplanes regularis]|uniref:Uncharacterized protein n=1 Tax=Actinoplanes regularis TaxID=52697 RepID=A0A238WRX1_9ACTN|nr:hypothetical protein [Actinoplanes regularis]GIE84660.1 hypothetical protein Are01nite_11400 [Actinoplanes regularis]GLW33042.1 hypothetical protein Areg01_59800 [Actinoplanes regularis]SNR48429.1 hypothetical protein SAMN06264365_102762 [Actinoplanes regularis]
MFATRNHRTERTASQAWEYLSAAMATAGETAKDAGKQALTTADRASRQGQRLAGDTGRRGRRLAAKANKRSHKLAHRASKKGQVLAGLAGDAADEAWTRANAAANALAGRRPGRPWGLIAGIGLLGLAAGWVAATTARAALEREAENEQLELSETAVMVTPTYGE